MRCVQILLMEFIVSYDLTDLNAFHQVEAKLLAEKKKREIQLIKCALCIRMLQHWYICCQNFVRWPSHASTVLMSA